MDKEAEAYELWTAEYPRDTAPHNNLGTNYMYMGQYEKALAEFQGGLRLNPDNALLYSNLGETYLSLNRLDEAKAALDQAFAHKLDSGILRSYVYSLAFLQGNSAQMEQQVAWAAGKPGDEDMLLSAQSDTEAYYGRMSKAREFSRRAVESAIRADSKETAASWQVNAAIREAELGNAVSAKEDVVGALALSSGRDVKIGAALTLARIGDALRAKALAEELERSYPTNTMLKLYWLPTINAAIELSEKNSSQAIMSLTAAAPYELGIPGNVSAAYPAYVRGQAYLLVTQRYCRSRRVSEIARPQGDRFEFCDGITGSPSTRSCLRSWQVRLQSESCLQGFPHPLERRRPRHPHPEASQGGVREAAVA